MQVGDTIYLVDHEINYVATIINIDHTNDLYTLSAQELPINEYGKPFKTEIYGRSLHAKLKSTTSKQNILKEIYG